MNLPARFECAACRYAWTHRDMSDWSVRPHYLDHSRGLDGPS